MLKTMTFMVFIPSRLLRYKSFTRINLSKVNIDDFTVHKTL